MEKMESGTNKYKTKKKNLKEKQRIKKKKPKQNKTPKTKQKIKNGNHFKRSHQQQRQHLSTCHQNLFKQQLSTKFLRPERAFEEYQVAVQRSEKAKTLWRRETDENRPKNRLFEAKASPIPTQTKKETDDRGQNHENE